MKNKLFNCARRWKALLHSMKNEVLALNIAFASNVPKLMVAFLLLFTLGMGQMWAETIKEDFEKQTAGTTYNSTQTYTAVNSNAGIAWFVEHGTVSTTSYLDGTKSMHMRAYYAKSSASNVWNGNLPYVNSTTNVQGLVSITFDAAVSNTYLKLDVMYSTNNGTTWSYMKQTSASGSDWNNVALTTTSKKNYSAYIPTAAISSTANYRIKIAVNSGVTHANKPGSAGNYTFRVDDIVFTYTAAATTYTVSYANGGGTGTAPSSHTGVTSGSSITLKTNTFTAPAGKQFAGWNDGTSTYDAGVSYTVTGNKTMTAQWSCITPTISVHPSDGSCVQGGSPTPLTVTAAAGTGTLTYQWKQCATSGGTYVNVTGGSGGTTASYTPPVSSVGTMYYKCVVTNTGSSCGTSATSNYASFVVTSAGCTTSPTVTAGSYSAVTSTTATVSCASGISSLGSAGCTITSYGFVIGTSTTPAIGGSGVTKHEVGTSYTTTGTAFSKNLTGLTAGTTYYVRPYATNGNGTSYGTQTSFTTTAAPSITVSQTSRAFGDRKVNGGPYTMTFTVSGSNLTANIGLSISGTNASLFSIDKTSLTQSAGSVATTTITVSYSPTSAGSHTATINITSSGATSKTVSLSGTGKWEVTWNNNGSTSTALVAGGTKPSFPATPSSCDGTSTTFIGWATASWTGKIANLTGKTVYTSAGDLPNASANVTYYAVFAKAGVGASTSYAAITSGLESNNYVIAYSYNGGTQIVLKNTADNANASTMLEGYNLSLSSSKYSNPDAAYIWALQKQADGSYYIYNSTVSKYVNATTSALTLSTTPTKFTISYDGTNSRWTIQLKDNTSYYMHGYVSGSNYDFRVSTSGSGAKYRVYLYKNESTTTYSDYLTTCVACSDNPTLSAAPTMSGTISLSSIGVTIGSASVRDNCEWTDYGFVWGTASNPTVSNNKVQVGTSGNATTWNGNLTGTFTVGTTYYFKGYGKNSKAGADFVYSSQSSFVLRSITFNSNGGTAVSTIYVKSGTTATQPADPTKDGYTFGGWYSNEGLTSAVNWSSSITANKTYYAKWIATPTLTVSPASIAFGTKAIDGSYTETFTVSGANLTANITIAVSGTNAGMFAVSTASISKGSGTVAATTITVTYTPTTAASHSATITVSSTGATSKTITLTGTGRYEDKFIDVVHNTTGYTEVSPHIETGSYSTPALSDKAAASTGTCDEVHYHFVGWITKTKHDAGTAIAAGDIKTPTTADGTTYYAVWAKEGTGGGGAAVNTVLYSENFGGYSADGVPSGKVNTSTGNRVVYGGGSVTYSVTNGGGTTKVYAASLAGGTSPELLVAKSSGTFVIAGIPKGGASELTLSYKQNGKSLTTSVSGTDYSGGKSSSTAGTTTTTITCGSASTFTLTFTAGSENVRLDDIEIKVKTAGITYTDYVSSCGETYNITLNKNGGTTNGAATVTENATQLNSGFTAPVWAGHQVEGYYTTSACATKVATAAGVLQNSITVSGTPWTDASGKWVKGGDATFYAKWEAKQCVITLNNVSATTAGTPSVTATYGANTNLTTSITKPEKTGYVFGGYYTEPSGAGTQLIDANGAWLASKTGYTNASKQWQLDAATLTVYAYWTIQTYTVNWYVNGISVAHEDNVPYNRQYSYLNNEPDVANNALASCNSNKFIGWVTADGQYTADGGTKSAQYDPYTVTGSTTITADRKDFYAMFATETGSSFDLSVTSGDFKIFGLVSDVRYYVTGALDNGAYEVTTDADDADEFTFTKVSDGVYTIKHKRSNKFVKWSGSTNFKEETTSEEWTITTASHGSWCMTPESATTRAFIMYYSSSNPENNNIFKPYSKSNATNTPAQYYYVEIGGGTLTDYRTGCCDEKITLNVTGATNGAYTLKFNNAAQTSGANVSTCAASTVEFKVTANAGYTLTNMSISGTNKTLTITPSPITTGLPSTNEMTYTVSVPALATGTLTITPTFTQTYSVTYNLDGGETAGSTATTRYQSGESVTLVTPNPTKTGYDFTGWTVTKAGGGTVTVSAGAFTMPSDNVTVTAGWTAKPLTSISVTPTTAEVYVGQYVVLPVTYDPADVLTKGYTLVATPGYCVTTGSTNTTLKLTGGRGGVSITEDKVETVSIKANADNTKTASVTITVKPLPVDHFLDLIHGQTFADQVATIVDNALSASYTAPGHDDVDAPVSGNDCEKGHLHLIGWIESEWADAHLTATMAEIKAAKDDGLNPLFHDVYSPMTASGKTYYAVWAHEVE